MKKLTLTFIFASAICIASFGQSTTAQSAQAAQTTNQANKVLTSKGGNKLNTSPAKLTATSVATTNLPNAATQAKLSAGNTISPSPKAVQSGNDNTTPADATPQQLMQLKQGPK